MSKEKSVTREHDEWEKSLEGINDRLGGVYGGTTFQDDIDQALICKVLQTVPEEVRNAVLESVTFILAANQQGTVFRMRFYPFEGQDYVERDFVLLTLTGSKKRKMTPIAHEIAHFYLQRDTEYGAGAVNSVHVAESERAADDLIETWGFTRVYSCYEQFESK